VKRPMNSFLLYSNEVRPFLQQKYKDRSNAQISKIIGEQWHTMSTDKKRKYVQKAEKIKEEFTREHPDFVYTKKKRRKRRRIKKRPGNHKTDNSKHSKASDVKGDLTQSSPSTSTPPSKRKALVDDEVEVEAEDDEADKEEDDGADKEEDDGDEKL